MKLMRILIVGLMMVGLPVVTAEKDNKVTATPVLVMPLPGHDPETAISPHHSPRSLQSSSSSVDLATAEDDEDDNSSTIGTSANFAGHLAEDQLQILVDEYVNIGNDRKLKELLGTCESRPQIFSKIIIAGIEKLNAQYENAFNEWFYGNKDDLIVLERELAAVEGEDAARGERVRDRIGVLREAQALAAAQRDITSVASSDSKLVADAVLPVSAKPSPAIAPAPKTLDGIMQPKRSWKRAAWFGVGVGVAAVAAAVAWYVWFKKPAALAR